MIHRPGLACVPIVLMLCAEGEGAGSVHLTQQQAIERAFPSPQRVERRILYLDSEQARQAGDLAGAPIEARVILYYVGTRDGHVTGYAYFDTHLVRSLQETILILVSPEGQILRIEVVSFGEPEDYLPMDRWLQQFAGRALDDELSLKRGIRSITGATLSARAVTQAARRVLALHHLFVAPPPAHVDQGRKPAEGEP